MGLNRVFETKKKWYNLEISHLHNMMHFAHNTMMVDQELDVQLRTYVHNYVLHTYVRMYTYICTYIHTHTHTLTNNIDNLAYES